MAIQYVIFKAFQNLIQTYNDMVVPWAPEMHKHWWWQWDDVQMHFLFILFPMFFKEVFSRPVLLICQSCYNYRKHLHPNFCVLREVCENTALSWYPLSQKKEIGKALIWICPCLMVLERVGFEAVTLMMWRILVEKSVRSLPDFQATRRSEKRSSRVCQCYAAAVPCWWAVGGVGGDRFRHRVIFPLPLSPVSISPLPSESDSRLLDGHVLKVSWWHGPRQPVLTVRVRVNRHVPQWFEVTLIQAAIELEATHAAGAGGVLGGVQGGAIGLR